MATIDASFVSGRPARGTDWLGRTATFCYLSIAEPPYFWADSRLSSRGQRLGSPP